MKRYIYSIAILFGALTLSSCNPMDNEPTNSYTDKNFWTPTNTDAKYPRLSEPGSSSSQNNFRMGSDLYILDGSYLRIKNITLGYTIPKTLTAKVGIEKLRVYVTGQNLFTFSHNSFIDPESSEFGSNMTNSGGNSGRNYPVLKYYGFGLDLEF